MKKIKIALVACTLMATTSTQLFAGDGDLSRIYRECGIGAMLFPKDGTLAVVSNVIWDLGTTATLSNMSSEDSCKGNSARVAAFIGSSYEKLEKEIATGKGEYVETLSKITGKSVKDIRASFTKVVNSKEFTKMSREERAEKLFKIVSI